MNPLLRCSILWLCVLLAGCASKPASTPKTSIRGTLSLSGEVSVQVGSLRDGSLDQVELSVRCLRIEGALPKAKGALKFLADKEALRAGTLLLSKEQLKPVIMSLGHSTIHDFRTAPTSMLAPGDTAKIKFLEETRSGDGSSGVKVSVGGVEQEFTVRQIGASLYVKPDVLADGKVQIEVNLEMVSLDGFVEFGGQQVVLTPRSDAEGSVQKTETIKVPLGFYQPVFTNKSYKKTILTPKNSVAVWMIAPTKNIERSASDGASKPGPTSIDLLPETWLIFFDATSVTKAQNSR